MPVTNNFASASGLGPFRMDQTCPFRLRGQETLGRGGFVPSDWAAESFAFVCGRKWWKSKNLAGIRLERMGNFDNIFNVHMIKTERTTIPFCLGHSDR
jgi:hypothetical protein